MRTLCDAALVLATALMLTACAGNGPQTPTAAATPAPAATANGGSTKLPKGFRRMTKDGQDYICQRGAAPGSRTEMVETCLTAAEFEDREKKGQDLLQGMQNTTLQPPAGNKAFTPGF